MWVPLSEREQRTTHFLHCSFFQPCTGHCFWYRIRIWNKLIAKKQSDKVPSCSLIFFITFTYTKRNLLKWIEWKKLTFGTKEIFFLKKTLLFSWEKILSLEKNVYLVKRIFSLALFTFHNVFFIYILFYTSWAKTILDQITRELYKVVKISWIFQQMEATLKLSYEEPR